MWKFYYCLMRMMPNRFLQRTFWWVLRKTGIAKRLCDEGFLKLQLLGVSGEVYSLTGGGVNSWIVWQRLHFHSSILVQGCDKYAVREIVKARIGEEYLVPLIAIDGCDVWSDPRSIDFSKLPQRFVLKCNNGSGMNMIVKDKSKIDWEAAIAKMETWLHSDYSEGSREYQYKQIPNKIICEKLIPTISGEPPDDYKIMCSNGVPLYIWVDTDRFTNHRRNVFTVDWIDEGVKIAYNRSEKVFPKPKNLQLMLELAGKMSAGIPLVRVDFYNVDGKIYFGELTFTSDCGIAITTPFSFSQAMARKVSSGSLSR